MKNLKFSLMFLLLIAVLFGCDSKEDKEEKSKEEVRTEEKGFLQPPDVEDKESFTYGDVSLENENQTKDEVNKEGSKQNKKNEKEGQSIETDGIILDNGSIKKSRKDIKAPVVVDYFFDPACPSCFNSSKELLSFDQDIRNGNVAIVFRPVPFLNDKTVGDYSNRATSYIRAMAEYTDYNKFTKFLIELSSDSFANKVQKDFVEDQEFANAMQRSGVTQEEFQVIENNKSNFVPIAIASAQEFVSASSPWKEFSSVQDKNGNLITYAPFILVNLKGEVGAKSLNQDNISEYIQYKIKK